MPQWHTRVCRFCLRNQGISKHAGFHVTPDRITAQLHSGFCPLAPLAALERLRWEAFPLTHRDALPITSDIAVLRIGDPEPRGNAVRGTLCPANPKLPPQL